jgi:hypothetical protein
MSETQYKYLENTMIVRIDQKSLVLTENEMRAGLVIRSGGVDGESITLAKWSVLFDNGSMESFDFGTLQELAFLSATENRIERFAVEPILITLPLIFCDRRYLVLAEAEWSKDPDNFVKHRPMVAELFCPSRKRRLGQVDRLQALFQEHLTKGEADVSSLESVSASSLPRTSLSESRVAPRERSQPLLGQVIIKHFPGHDVFGRQNTVSAVVRSCDAGRATLVYENKFVETITAPAARKLLKLTVNEERLERCVHSISADPRLTPTPFPIFLCIHVPSDTLSGLRRTGRHVRSRGRRDLITGVDAICCGSWWRGEPPWTLP